MSQSANHAPNGRFHRGRRPPLRASGPGALPSGAAGHGPRLPPASIARKTAIPARLSSASTFDYATTLSSDGVSIGTVEHLLSAAAGEGPRQLHRRDRRARGPHPGRVGSSFRPPLPRRRLRAPGRAGPAARARPGDRRLERGDRSIRYTPDGDAPRRSPTRSTSRTRRRQAGADLDRPRRGLRGAHRAGAHVRLPARGRSSCAPAAWPAADRSRTPSCSTTRASSRALCGSATSSCATRSWTSWATWPCSVGRSTGASTRRRRATPCTSSSPARSSRRPGTRREARGSPPRSPPTRRQRPPLARWPPGAAASPRIPPWRRPAGRLRHLLRLCVGRPGARRPRRRGRGGEAAGHGPARDDPRLRRLPQVPADGAS